MQVLRGKEDVLLAFDGVAIANDGTVPFRSGERISFSYLVSQKYTNESATLRVLKDGKEVTVDVMLQVRQGVTMMTGIEGFTVKVLISEP